MKADRKRQVIYLLLGITLVVNVVILVSRLKSRGPIPSGTRQDLIEEQTNRLAKWASQAAIPKSSFSEWSDAIKSALDENCLEVPKGAITVAATEVSSDQLDSLYKAVAGLLKVYADNSPESMITYMQEHGERLNPRRVEELRDLLANAPNGSKATVKSLTPEEVYVTFWRTAKLNARIASLLKESVCYQIWRYNHPPTVAALESSIGTSEGFVFGNVAQLIPTFESQRRIDDVLRSDGSVLYADFKVVVQLDAKMYNQVMPYFFRFWYEPTEKVWHPYRLGRVQTVGEGVAHIQF